MSVIVVIILVFFVLATGLGAVAYMTYRRKLRRAKAIERGLKMVPILIHLPPPSSDTEGGSRDIREVMREKTSQAEVLYNLIAGTATEGFKSTFYGQRHIALELIAIDGIVHFFVAVPVALVSVVKKAVLTAYAGARLEEVEDHNIFNQEGRLAATMGGEMVLRQESAYPIATYEQLERDPMEALLTTISALDKNDGVAFQLMIRPAKPNWTKRSVDLSNMKRRGRGADLHFTPQDLAMAAVKAPTQRIEERRAMAGGQDLSNLELQTIEKIEEKTKHPGFEILIRIVVSTGSVARSQQLLRDIATAFALFEAPGLNGFKFLPALDVQGLVTAFIFRFFPTEITSNVLSSVELATLFHLPDSQFTPSRSVERQMSKQVDGPVSLPAVGLMFGYNEFRGVRKEIRLSPEDRRRHTYILGQTGTGKSTMLENLAVQDMVAGNGFAFIDPHGDSAEKLLAMVPKERAEDVIYFNPADTEYPLGLNMFEFNDPAQKDFIVQETINMLYKLYDPGHTGIIGPRYEHWYRNAALTLMSDPNGSTFIEIPKVFTDTEYLKKKFKYLRDPTVIDFWTKEMGQTSDYHKSEMLGWFVSKFGAFQNNEMMRNIIGQTTSSFNLRDVMDHKKILIVNLSKGRIGELNSQLLGMIFVIKFQAAAMSRADMPEDQRNDFCLYVDEFQNFSTDSFASILSEARKYRLNLIVANQFIGQLNTEVRDAVFGNIGTIVAHRMGPEDAEFMVKQFAPAFDMSDLVNIPNFNAVMRLMIGGLPSQPFSIRDSAPLGTSNLELGAAVKQLSAAKFGRTRGAVEADIMDRLSGRAPAPAAAPSTPVPAPVPPAEVSEPSQSPVAGGGAAYGDSVSAPAAIVEPELAPSAPAPQQAQVPEMPQTQVMVGSDLDELAPAAAPASQPLSEASPIGSQLAPSPAKSAAGGEPAVLSLSDITGKRRPAPPAPPPFDPSSVPLIPQGSEPPVQPAGAGLPSVPEPVVRPAESLDLGRPLADDPYANIDLLGDASSRPGEQQAQTKVVPHGQPEPLFAPGLSATPEPVLLPQADTSAQDALQGQSPDELIHFVDPAAQSVLERPDAPVDQVEPPIDQAPAPLPVTNQDLVGQAMDNIPPAPAPIPISVPAAAPVASIAPSTPPVTVPAAQETSAEAPLPEAPQGSIAEPTKQPVQVSAAAVPPAPEPGPVPELEYAPSVASTLPVSQSISVLPVSAAPPQLAPQVAEPAPLPIPNPAPVAIPVPETPASAAPSSAPLPLPTPMQAPASVPNLPQIEGAAVASAPVGQSGSVSTSIHQAEREIDNLLSTSLIRPDTSLAHRRLPEPVEPPPVQNAGVDLELASRAQPSPAKFETKDQAPAEHHSLKVIQPLEPIVPPKEKLAQELAALDRVEQAADLKPSNPTPGAIAAPVYRQTGPESALPNPAELSAEIVRHSGEILPDQQPSQQSPQVQPPRQVEDEFGIPQAESLAANDVAKARAEEEAKAASEASQQVQLVPVPVPSLAEVSPASQNGSLAQQATEERAAKPDDKPTQKEPDRPKRKRKGKTTNFEKVESAAEAEHNQPTAEQEEAGSLTGKLILPTAKKPEQSVAKPVLEKPKKLAPGEVFVDEKGNVLIGE
jgi:hypothetical protein